MESKALTKGDQWSASGASGTLPRAEEEFEMPFTIGQVIAGKFEITKLLGVGGVGFVVAANHLELGQKVALKFLKPDMLANTQVAGRFAHEALAAARIKSEHVARVYDVGSLEDGTPFIVMEFLDGRDLFDIVTQDGPQPVRLAVDYMLQACEALADAHSCGIVHRDVKPENLFLLHRSEGIELIKILDFGISKLALTGSAFKSNVPLVKTMLPVGSPVYMSPEQIRASKETDHRTDIWSLGCVLYELLTGGAAFDAPTLTQLSAAILETNPTPPSRHRPDVPPEIDAIVKRCLEKNPADRFQNVAQLAMALYPYGPRRSRIHAERCCRLLKVLGSTNAEFELPSVRPPNWEVMTSGAFPTAEPRSAPTKRPSSTQDQIATFHPAYRSKKFAIATVAFVVAAALAFGLFRNRLRTPDAPAVETGPRSSAPVELLSPPAIAAAKKVQLDSQDPKENIAPAPARALAAANSAEGEASAATTKFPTAKPMGNLQHRLPVRPPTRSKARAGGESTSGNRIEPDPGF
jgi:serine/threonine protein kinase